MTPSKISLPLQCCVFRYVRLFASPRRSRRARYLRAGDHLGLRRALCDGRSGESLRDECEDSNHQEDRCKEANQLAEFNRDEFCTLGDGGGMLER